MPFCGRMSRPTSVSPAVTPVIGTAALVAAGVLVSNDTRPAVVRVNAVAGTVRSSSGSTRRRDGMRESRWWGSSPEPVGRTGIIHDGRTRRPDGDEIARGPPAPAGGRASVLFSADEDAVEGGAAERVERGRGRLGRPAHVLAQV